MTAIPFTIDELATLSDQEALRRDSDRRIRAMLRWVVLFFTLFSLVHTMSRVGVMVRGEARMFAVACTGFVLGAVLLLAYRRIKKLDRGAGGRSWVDPVTRLLLNQPRGVALTYLVVQLWLLMFSMFSNRQGVPWFVIFPLLVLLFRVAPAERFAIHAIFLLSSVVGWLGPVIFLSSNKSVEYVAEGATANSVALLIGLGLTRRSSRRFLAEWRKSRAQARDQIRMRQELEYARKIQLSMLPLDTPHLEWMDLATISLPATEVGGDYYDFFLRGEDSLVLVSADVAGHGLGSGLVLSGVRSGLVLLSDDLDHPELVMRRLHQMLRKTAGSRMLVTMALLSLDRASGLARYASAGHPPLLIRRAKSQSIEEVLRSSLPLGAALSGRFSVDEIAFARGDVFVLHTDGVYETRNPEGESYGLPRLENVIAGVPLTATAAAIRDAVLEDLLAFRGRGPQEDDITLVIARVC